MVAPLRDPPARLPADPPTRSWGAWQPMVRVYHEHPSRDGMAPRRFGPLNRFDPHVRDRRQQPREDPHGRGVLYLARDLGTALAEAYPGQWPGVGICPHARADWARPAVAHIPLLDLTGNGAMRIGAVGTVAWGDEPRRRTQRWGRRIYEQYSPRRRACARDHACARPRSRGSRSLRRLDRHLRHHDGADPLRRLDHVGRPLRRRRGLCHDFTGLISGNAVSGTFKDRPGYRAHATGKITAHVVDECQLKLDVVAVDGGRTWSENGELFSKVMCSGAIDSTAPVPISSVSNGCGGAGWDSLVAVQNYLGNVSVYRNSNINPLAKAYRVNFREACNLHDAGYSGAIVKDKLHGGTIIDTRGWSRAAVDDKFLDDMRLLCRRAIPAKAKVALRNCKRRGGNASFGAESRANFVRSWGHLFFDADLTQPGTQRTGPRTNDVT